MKRCKDYVAISKDPNDLGKESQKWWYRANYFAPLSSAQKYIDDKYVDRIALFDVVGPFGKNLISAISSMQPLSDYVEQEGAYLSLIQECSSLVDKILSVSKCHIMTEEEELCSIVSDMTDFERFVYLNDIKHPHVLSNMVKYCNRYAGTYFDVVQDLSAYKAVSGDAEALSSYILKYSGSSEEDCSEDVYERSCSAILDDLESFAEMVSENSLHFSRIDNEDEEVVQQTTGSGKKVLQKREGKSVTWNGETIVMDASEHCSIAIPNRWLTLSPVKSFELANYLYETFKDDFDRCCKFITERYIWKQLMSRAFLYYIYEIGRDAGIKPDEYGAGTLFSLVFGDEGEAGEGNVDIGKPSLDPLSLGLGNFAQFAACAALKKIDPDLYESTFGTDKMVFDPTETWAVDRVMNGGSIFGKIMKPSYLKARLISNASDLDMAGSMCAGALWLLGQTINGEEHDVGFVEDLRKQIARAKEALEYLLKQLEDESTDNDRSLKDDHIPKATMIIKVGDENEGIDRCVSIRIQSALKAINEFTYEWQQYMGTARWICWSDGVDCYAKGNRRKYRLETKNDIGWGFDVEIVAINGWEGSVEVIVGSNDYFNGHSENPGETRIQSCTVNLTKDKPRKNVYVGTGGIRKTQRVPWQGGGYAIPVYSYERTGVFCHEWNPVQQYHGG